MSHPTPEPRGRRTALIALLALLSVTALGGGALLMARPDGSLMGMSPGDFATTFFSDFFWPGVILFTVFGIGSAVAAVGVSRRLVAGTTAAMLIGSGQMIWILAQTVMIEHLSWLQAFYALLGVAITALASYERRRDKVPHVL